MLKSHVVRELFVKHARELNAIISAKFKNSSHDAEDLVQEAFHNFLKVDEIERISDPKSFLLQTASNLAISRLRKQGNHSRYLSEMDHQAEYELTPERAVSGEKDLEKLQEALDRLPEKYRRTFLLSRMEGLSYREISAKLEIPQSTVEKHIIKTLRHLRDTLRSEDE